MRLTGEKVDLSARFWQVLTSLFVYFDWNGPIIFIEDNNLYVSCFYELSNQDA